MYRDRSSYHELPQGKRCSVDRRLAVLELFQSRKKSPKVSVHGLRSVRSATGSLALRHPSGTVTCSIRNMQVSEHPHAITAAPAAFAHDRRFHRHHTELGPQATIQAVRRLSDWQNISVKKRHLVMTCNASSAVAPPHSHNTRVLTTLSGSLTLVATDLP